jgi:prepilin peptidase CpaA
MSSFVWWSNVTVLLVASGIDVRTRRVPNWLSIPFLCAGILYQALSSGWQGAGHAFQGIALAIIFYGIPCILLRGTGMGDLKLAAGIGSWIGPGQFTMAFMITGLIGGIMAVGYALWYRRLGECLDNTGDLLVHIGKQGLQPHERMRIENRAALSIPYVPAIAIGALCSFFL